MLNVRQAVDRIVAEDADYKHSQTVIISERAHAKLRALAEFMDRTKSGLASELLMAAIDDAIEHLSETPLTPTPGAAFEDGSPATLGHLIERRAERVYQEFVDLQEDMKQAEDEAHAENLESLRAARRSRR